MSKRRRKLKPQMLLKETFYPTKKSLHSTFRNLKSFLLQRFQKLPQNPIFSGGAKASSKVLDQENVYRNGKNPKKKMGRTEGEESRRNKNSTNVAAQSGLKGLKEPGSSVDSLAQKMKELEMMDHQSDEAHGLDLQEVLDSYSLLTSPVYLDLVDRFFMDMYTEFHFNNPSASPNSSVRKLGPACVHTLMRKTGPASAHGSMRKIGSASVHGSMRKLGSASVHGSMRKIGTTSVRGSMRNLAPLNL